MIWKQRQQDQPKISSIIWDEVSTRPRRERAVLRRVLRRAERFVFPPADLRRRGAVVITEKPGLLPRGRPGVQLDVVYASYAQLPCDHSWSVTAQTYDELAALIAYVVASDALLGFPAKIVGSFEFTLLFEELLAERP